MSPHRGDVYWATLQTREGDEHRHMVAVVSRDVVNLHLKPIVALVTSEERDRGIPTHVEVDPRENAFVSRTSWILCHDLATIERDDLDPRPLGELSVRATIALDTSLAIALGLRELPEVA